MVSVAARETERRPPGEHRRQLAGVETTGPEIRRAGAGLTSRRRAQLKTMGIIAAYRVNDEGSDAVTQPRRPLGSSAAPKCCRHDRKGEGRRGERHDAGAAAA